MKRFIPLTMVLSLSLVACEQHTNTPPPRGVDSDKTEKNMRERNLGAATPNGYTETSMPNRDVRPMNPADNTETNTRDRDLTTVTPPNQTESEADRAITQKIRQAIMADDSLSINAKNIKIVTMNGVVTLRGPVASLQEKDLITKKVTAIQGVVRVDNQLEVTK